MYSQSETTKNVSTSAKSGFMNSSGHACVLCFAA
jgi:hypothetical protein